MSFDFSILVTDRTQADVEARNDKGTYQAADLNRVTQAMDALANQFSVLGYSTAGYQRIKAVEQEAPRIPEGYTELESITSSGTQYINTGVNPTSNTRVELRMSTSQSGSKTVFGSDVGWTANGFALGVNFAHYGTKNGSFTGLNDGGAHTVDFNRNSISLDGAKVLTLGETVFELAYPLYLFCNDRSSAAQEHTSMILYACKIYEQTRLVRDLVPCKDPAGAIGLYDTVEAQFYKNAGSGAFAAGSEVIRPEVDPYEWKEEYYPTVEQMAQYIANVEALRGVIAVLPSTPATPESMELLDYIRANEIEQILADIDKLLKNMPSAWFYSGEVECGEV